MNLSCDCPFQYLQSKWQSYYNTSWFWLRFAPYYHSVTEALRALLPEGSGGAMRHITTKTGDKSSNKKLFKLFVTKALSYDLQ